MSERELQAQDWSGLPTSEIAITVLQAWAIRKGLTPPDDDEAIEIICEEWLKLASEENR